MKLRCRYVGFGCALFFSLILLEVILQIVSLSRYTLIRITKYRETIGANWYANELDHKWWYSEGKNIRLVYHPLLGWKVASMKTPHITVDEDGYRVTTGTPPDKVLGQINISIYGGSSVWGYHVSDEQTIPSILSDLIADNDYVVHNRGQLIYNVNQELMAFILDVKTKPPNIAIFYDGCNDSGMSFQELDIGSLVFREDHISNELGDMWGYMNDDVKNQSVFGFRFVGELWKLATEYIKVIHYSNAFMRKLIDRSITTEQTGTSPDVEVFAEKIANNLVKNYELINIISAAYNVNTFIIRQPTVFSKSLTPDEAEIMQSLKRNKQHESSDKLEYYTKVYTRVSQLLKEKQITGYYDFSDVLDPYVSQSFFTDACHISEEGNNIVSREIYNMLRNIIN